MLIKDIELDKIKQLLEQLPSDVDVLSIDLSKGYDVIMSYSLKLHSSINSDLLMAEIQAKFKELDKSFEKYNQNKEGNP